MDPRLRQIAHLDLDSFFVSVERLHDPSLIGKPVVVGGSPEGRGVVASASYEARAFGVRSAMPTGQALRLCPALIVVRSRHGMYGEYSDRIYERMCQLAPVVERASIDEMYMDFTGCDSLYDNNLPGFMRTVQTLVRREFGLPCSIALASSKTLAKIAVGTVKPEGVCVVPHGTEQDFLAPLPVSVIPGVGAKSEQTLHRAGFRLVGDLQQTTEDRLVRLLGAHGTWLHRVACGRGSEVVSSEHIRKSIGHEQTFSRDIAERADLERILFEEVEEVCSSLRSYGWRARTVSLKLRYGDFTTITRARTVEPTDHDPVVFDTLRELFRKAWRSGRPVRLLGVQLSNFDYGEQLELPLFTDETRRRQMLSAVEKIRTRYGENSIHIGGV
jgi:DNA polymerase-4